MRSKSMESCLPFVFTVLALVLCMWLSGCAASFRIATDAQHQARSRDRVLINRAHGSYTGDNATTLDEYRERYRKAKTVNGSQGE